MLGGIDISITQEDILAVIGINNIQNGGKEIENTENAQNDIEKDGIDPSLTNITFHSDKIVGSTNNILLYNFDRSRQFAWFEGSIYVPRRAHKGQLLSRKERLWLFMTVRTAVEKRLMAHLEFVKHSSM